MASDTARWKSSTMVSLLPFGGALARCVLGVEVVEVGEDSHARDTLISRLFSVFLYTKEASNPAEELDVFLC